MAAAIQKLHDHYLSCIICTDLYKDPCTLACGHTFCRGCLATFTKTQQDAIKAKSIHCPNCRQMTKVTNPGRPVEEWVNEFKPSFLIQGLVDDFASQQGPEKDTGSLCFSCHQNDETTPASSHCIDCDLSLCDKCVKVHRAMPISSHHRFSELDGEVKMRRKRKVICKSHSCIVEFCCRDCRQLICQKCCILNHRKCDSVVTLESMVSEMKAALKKSKEILTEKGKKSKSASIQKRSKIEEIDGKKASIESEIAKVTQNAITMIKQKEQALMYDIKDITDKQIGELKGQMKSEEIDMQMYQQQCEFIDQALITESEVDMYEMYLMCESKTAETVSETDTWKADTSLMGDFEFIQQFDQEMINKHIQLGSIMASKFDPQCTPTLVDTINITTENERSADAIDVTIMNVDGTQTMVITDYINKCVKSFYTKDTSSWHSSLKVDCWPWCLTRLNNSEAAVSFHSEPIIMVISVIPALVLKSRITTQKKYISLTALDASTLAGGCCNPPSLDILDVTGCVKRSILVDNSLIKGPHFLSTTITGNILVSDPGPKSVYCLTTKGDVVFNYAQKGDRALGEPRGLTTSRNGDVLVADKVNDKVVQLTGAGDYVRDILTSQDGIASPYGICIHNDTLYVTQEKGPVKVFKVNRK